MNDVKYICQFVPVYCGGNAKRDEFLKAVTDAIAPFPENATFSLSVEDDYDDAHYARIEVNYTRPKTPQEINADAITHAQRVNWERKQYEALKKKFGP